MLRKAHKRAAPYLSSLLKVALKTVPIFAWLSIDCSPPRSSTYEINYFTKTGTLLFTVDIAHHFLTLSDMGLRKSEKGGKWCGGLGAAVGPQWGPGAKPLVGVWGQRPQKLKVFSVCHHKKQHSGAWKSDICKSASFMFRPNIYLVILKIALKMSFWCSKNKILAKVSNYLTVGILL